MESITNISARKPKGATVQISPNKENTPIRPKILNPATNRWIYADGCKGALLSAGVDKPLPKPRPQPVQESPTTPRQRPVQTPRGSKKPQPVPVKPKGIVEKPILKTKMTIKSKIPVRPVIQSVANITPRLPMYPVKTKAPVSIRSTKILEPKIRKTMASFFVKPPKM